MPSAAIVVLEAGAGTVLGAGAGAGIAAAGDADPPWIVPAGHDTAEIVCRVPLIRRKGKRSTVLD